MREGTLIFHIFRTSQRTEIYLQVQELNVEELEELVEQMATWLDTLVTRLYGMKRDLEGLMQLKDMLQDVLT